LITIGQLARYVGVSIKTIRVYHAKGPLAEPGRDASGYRRYSAQDVIEVIKIRTMADAGVPLGKIRDIKAAPDETFQSALMQIDDDLTARIEVLRQTQRRLHEFAAGRTRLLPDEVDRHLQRLAQLGFSDRWVQMEGDLWILVFVTHPEIALGLFRDQDEATADADLCQLYLDYDRSHDRHPTDPALGELARRIARATVQRYGTG
jgi:DNA-binding transcriptional MerR regulator